MQSSDSNAADGNDRDPVNPEDEIIEIPVKEILVNEILVNEIPAKAIASRNAPGGSRRPQGSWLGRILAFLCLIAIAVAGFGSSAGWFDFSNQATTQSTISLASDEAAGSPQPIADSPAGVAGTVVQPDTPPLAGPLPNSSQVAVESLPPLDTLMSNDSQSLLAELKRVSKHLQAVMPGSVEAREMAARVELEFGDLAKARSIWEEILSANPNNAYALRGLGDICTDNGELAEAVKYFRRAVVVDPENIARQITLGAALTRAGELEQSKEVLESVLARVPKHVGAQLELGTVLSSLSDFEGAKTHFEAALNGVISPADAAKAHFGLIKVYQRLRDREQAAFHQAEYKRLESSNTTERQDGRRNYDDVKAIGEDVGRFYVDMARVYMSGSKPRSAEILLLRASEMDKQNFDCRQALAFLSVTQGKLFDAIRWLNELAALMPNDFSFVQEIARIYVQLGQPRDAEQVLTKFVEAHPQDGVALRSVAEFYVETQLGFEPAIEYASKATQVAPTADNFALLASLYATTGKIPEAIQSLERAAEIEPANVSYSQTLRMLKENQNEAPGKAVN